jgi:hypothetical protein
MPTPPAPHNLLTPFQRAVLNAVATNRAAADFALAGGTAIAEFYLGHRHSDDLDFFSLTGEGIPDLGAWIVSALPGAVPDAHVEALRTFAAHHRYLVSSSTSDRILVDLGVADPGLLAPIQRVGDVRVLAVDDLAIGKMLAVHDRAELKDAIDLCFLAESGYDLAWLRRRALERDLGLADAPLTAVANLKAINPHTMPWPPMVKPLASDALQRFLADAISILLRDIALAQRELPRPSDEIG